MMKYFVEYKMDWSGNKVWKHYHDDAEILRRVLESLKRSGAEILTYGQERI